MKKYIFFAFLCLLIPTHLIADPYDELAKEIVHSTKNLKNKKIAVLPLRYIDKKDSPGPEIVSERLTTRIVQTQSLQVIERNLIDKVLSEKKLGLTGVIDEKTSQDVGTVLGVDAVLTGSLNDIGDQKTEINLRLINANDGRVLVAFKKTIEKTWKDPPLLEPASKHEEVAPTKSAQVSNSESMINNEDESSAPIARAPSKTTDNRRRTYVYVGSRNSNKYHLPSCKWARRIKPENLVTFNSREEAESKGYVPCKVCRP